MVSAGRPGRSRRAPDNLPRPAHWAEDAACREADPGLFHPEGDAGTVHLMTQEAKAWCARCGVQEACLQDAMARGERWGVWGGLGERERRAILRRRQERARAARRRARKREEADLDASEPADDPAETSAA